MHQNYDNDKGYQASLRQESFYNQSLNPKQNEIKSINEGIYPNKNTTYEPKM